MTKCDYAEWSGPRIIETAPSSGAIARFPSIATARSGESYIVGNDIAGFTTDTVRKNPLTIQTIGGKAPGHPPGEFRFVYPKAMIDGRDRLRLFWAEPPEGAPPIIARDWHTRPRPTSIWTAVFEPTPGWSTPRKVLEDPDLWWNEGISVAPTDLAAGQWLLAIPTMRRGPRPSRIHLVGLADDSIVTAVVPPRAGLYAGVASHGDQVYASYLAPAPLNHPGTDGNSVHLRTSSDGGDSWSTPILVSRSGSFPAYELQPLTGPDGVVHLIWLQDVEGGPPVIRHVSSSDRGRTWSLPDDLHPPPKAVGLQAAIDRCGTLHLIFEHWDPNWNVQLNYVTKQRHWSPIQPLFGTWRIAGGTALHRAPDDRLVLAFIGQPATAPITAPMSTLYAELAPR